MKVAIACDHAGYNTKIVLVSYLTSLGSEVLDFGTYNEESADYPDFAHPMAYAVENGMADFGVSLCGSGNGINMTVNKHTRIRAALCWNVEIATLARLHNDANICSIPARFVGVDEALRILKAFHSTQFEGGRHIARVNKIPINNAF